MPDPVTNTPNANLATKSPLVDQTSSAPVPGGVSSDKSTYESLQPKKPGISKRLTGVIKAVIESIRKMLAATIYAIKDVFLCIIPFKSIFLNKTPSETESTYLEYHQKLYRVDSLLPLLAKKEAEDLQKKHGFNAFEKVGELDFNKNASILSYFPLSKKPTSEEKIRLGEKLARKNPPLELIAVLKDYYTDQIPKLEIELKREKESK